LKNQWLVLSSYAVPPHKAPSVVVEAGFAEKEKFMQIDRTCKTNFENVYAIGDVNQIMLQNKLQFQRQESLQKERCLPLEYHFKNKKRTRKKRVFDGQRRMFCRSWQKIAGIYK